MAMSGGAAGAPPHKRFLTPFLRRGISLLEVLISMFVLLFGLMGVAAIFPVGNHYAGRGEQYDRSAALTDQAFAEIRARGLLRPELWMYPEAPTRSQNGALENDVYRVILPTTVNAGSFNLTLHGGNDGPGHAFVLDPLGVAAAREVSGQDRGVDVFPFAALGTNPDAPNGVATDENGDPLATNTQMPAIWSRNGNSPVLDGNRWPIRRITVPSDNPLVPTMTPSVAEAICRLQDDVVNQEPEQDDRPGHLRWRSQVEGAPDDPSKFDPGNPSTLTYGNDIPLSRQYGGSYSWLATIVPTTYVYGLQTPDALQALQPNDLNFGDFLYEVSVAVFYKRVEEPSAQSERAVTASMNLGGELILHAPNTPEGAEAVDAAVADLRPGHWIAVTGVHPTKGTFLLKWYKLLSLDNETARNQVIHPDVDAPWNGTFAVRRAMLEGADWPYPIDSATQLPETATDLRALIMPGVIGVSTQLLPMERAN